MTTTQNLADLRAADQEAQRNLIRAGASGDLGRYRRAVAVRNRTHNALMAALGKRA